MKAWHFVGETLRDGRPVPADGEWLKHDGELEMCKSGLHASVRLIDALKYAPGATICRVELDGEIVEDDDKVVAMRRRIVWRVDGDGLLREFARWCALQVIHLWNAPDVVREYLETGNEDLRDAAGAAAWDAAGAAAGGAARDAAGAAAWDAAGDAAWAAAWGAAWDAAWGAAGAAAWDAAGAAAWDAAGDAAWAAAWGAARGAQNERLEQLAREARR
jgi:hypothetical protein